jgi:hypothetical protein
MKKKNEITQGTSSNTGKRSYLPPAIEVVYVELESCIMAGSASQSVSTSIQENEWENGGTTPGSDITFN